MLLLGFELQDALGIVVGLALVLLTVYRRELSCNRGYHPEDGDDENDSLDDSEHRLLRREDRGTPSRSDDDGGSPSTNMRRSNSLSALTAMSHSRPGDEHWADRRKNENPTEELLESAGLFLSGGPFLAMAVAIFDHVVGISFGTCARSLHQMFRAKADVGNGVDCDDETSQQLSESDHDSIDEARGQRHLYSVAWNAATEYFTSISSKLKSGPSFTGQRENNDDSPSRERYPRSKSTGNIQHLSDERTRALFHEMIVMGFRGSMDVTLLPSDAQIGIFSYLYPQDVLAFTCTNRAGRKLLEDADCGEEMVEAVAGDDDDDLHFKNSDTALLIWKALFYRDYSWVLSDWKIGKEAFLRSMDHSENQGLPLHSWLLGSLERRQHHDSKSGKVFRHLTSIILNSERDVSDSSPIVSIMAAASSSAHILPTSSMKDFYFTFSETWLNYTIAGCNSTEKCLIGLHGHVFDISNFVEHHPGSTETLLLQAGRDATVFFESIGHSLGARKLTLGMCAVVNGQCCRVHFTEEESGPSKFQFRGGPLGPLFSTCGLIKPTCRSLDRKRSIVGFQIPMKKSRPRYHGGLRRIRERIRREENLQLVDAARWQSESLGANLFGGVHVYYDPFRGWKWWYTARDFNAVFVVPPREE